MENSRLITVLSAFDKSQWRAFGRFLESPYFNRRRDVVQLSEVLNRLLVRSDSSAQTFDKQQLWKKAFPGQIYDDKEMRYIMSYLLDLARRFLVQEHFEKNELAQDWFAQAAFQRLGLSSASKNQPDQRTMAVVQSDFDVALHRVSMRQQRDESVKEAKFGLDAAHEYFGRFSDAVLAEIFREACIQQDFQVRNGVKPAFELAEKITEWVEAQGPDKEFSIDMALNYRVFKMLSSAGTDQGRAHFFQLKTLLQRCGEAPMLYAREAWLRAINYAIRQQNQGDKQFGIEAFELYKLGLAQGLMLENGQISKNAYTNTLVLALLVGEWDWAEHFLSEYKDFLPEKERENTYRHNLATLYFKQKRFEKVLETLQNVNFTDMMHNLDDRRLLLCSFYELQSWSALDSLLDSFAVWLRRAKNLGYHRELYANLVRFTRRLVEVQGLGADVRDKLKTEIATTKNVAAKEWLLEKVSKL